MSTARRYLRTVRKLARDEQVPRWLRGLLIFGLLPIPGPVDNIALAVAAVILATAYRARIAEHYAAELARDAIVPLCTWDGGAW